MSRNVWPQEMNILMTAAMFTLQPSCSLLAFTTQNFNSMVTSWRQAIPQIVFMAGHWKKSLP